MRKPSLTFRLPDGTRRYYWTNLALIARKQVFEDLVCELFFHGYSLRYVSTGSGCMDYIFSKGRFSATASIDENAMVVKFMIEKI